MAIVQQVKTATHCISWINCVGVAPELNHEVAVFEIDDYGNMIPDEVCLRKGLDYDEAEAVFLRYCRKYKYE